MATTIEWPRHEIEAAFVSVLENFEGEVSRATLARLLVEAIDEAGYVVVSESDTRQSAWNSINKWIKKGPLPWPQDAQRNGMVLAANLVLNPQ